MTRTDNQTKRVPVSRRERKTLQQRDRIYKVALTLFGKHGFDDVTVEAITERADVAKGTFFNYFPSKTDVLVAFWTDVLDDVLTHGESIRAVSGRECFRVFFSYLARRVRGNADIFDALVRRVGQEPSLHHVDEHAAERESQLFQRYLETGHRANEFEQRHDTAIVSEIVRDLWVGSLRNWIFSGRGFSLTRRLNKKLDVLWSALVL